MTQSKQSKKILAHIAIAAGLSLAFFAAIVASIQTTAWMLKIASPATAAVIGIIVWLGNLVLGTPQALLLGILAGLLEVIPNLGPFLATIPAVLLALLFGSSYLPVENWAFALIIIIFYILVQTRHYLF